MQMKKVAPWVFEEVSCLSWYCSSLSLGFSSMSSLFALTAIDFEWDIVVGV